MKTLKYLLFVVIVLFSSSCSDYLDKMPEDQLTLEMVFSDKIRTEEWLAGIYTNIPEPYWGYAREQGYDALSDDLAPSTRWEVYGWTIVSKQLGNWNPSTSWDPTYWSELPKRIRSAYIFIENVKSNPSQMVTEEDATNMKNEARFLIAYYYSLMIDSYGPIPFKPGLIPLDAPEEELMLGQSPIDETIAWIDKELKELSTLLPASYSENEKFGRATSIMCLAVRARMLLFAASPLINGNPDYKGFVNYKGVELFNSAYDAGKWTKAMNACKELVVAAEANGHGLYYEYNTDGSIDPFLSYQNMMFKKTTDGNNEILFARPQCNSSGYDAFAQPRGTGGNGGLGITQSLVDAFYMKNGLPIDDPNSGYVEKGFSTNTEVRNTKWIEVKGNGQVTLPGTYNMYCNREARFYISVLYNDCWFRREKRNTRFYYGSSDGGPTHDAPQNGYLVRKKVHPDHDPRNKINPYRPGILYRLGEAYLNYAEALNEVEPGNPDILKYVNKIRERGGIPGLTAGMTKEEMRKAIYRERRVELNCEGIRYRDIRRWKIGEETIDGNFWGMNFFGTKKSDDESDPLAFYQREIYQVRKFDKRNYWIPVPQGEIDKNPNLVQNPFWE